MKNIPEELLPVIEWWERHGKNALVVVGVSAACVAGYYGVKNWRESRRIAAADALFSAYSVQDLEGAVAKFGDTKSGPALRQRLAQKYFDDGNYQLALEAYEALDGKAPEGFEDVPVVGKAACLEALGQFEKACDAYRAFAESKPKSLYALTAKLGLARTLAAQGRRDEAVKGLEAAKAEVADDEVAKSRVEATLDLVKRWEKREPLPEAVEAPAAPEAAAAAPEAPKADGQPAEAPKAEAKPAEAGKAAAAE